nr:6K2 [Tobacco mosqueado virus]
SKGALARDLKLKGVWNAPLIARDAIIACGIATGGAWLLYSWFTSQFTSVTHQ